MNVTFEASPLVWIVVRGQLRADDSGNRDDGCLIVALMDFLDRSNIIPAGTGKFVGTGFLSLGLPPDAAPAVIAWLKARGVTELPPSLASTQRKPEASAT